MAAFIYLGFLAAGDEIGQPFGMFLMAILAMRDALTINPPPPPHLGYDEVSDSVRFLSALDIDRRCRMIWTWT